MVNLLKDLVFLIMQFLVELNLIEAAHMLEKETGLFFDLDYFEGLLLDGNWEEAEYYLSGFTRVHDNSYSTKIYFEIRKQKYLEALDRQEHGVAIDILRRDLRVFADENRELYAEMAQLLTLDNFREHTALTNYGDALSARRRMVHDVKRVIRGHPLLWQKIRFPQVSSSRLRHLINQSLNWQHLQCAQPLPEPHVESLFRDHTCPEADADFILDQLDQEFSSITMATPLPTSSFTDSTSDQFDETLISRRATNPRNIPDEAFTDSEDFDDNLSVYSESSVNQVVKLTNEFPCIVEASRCHSGLLTSKYTMNPIRRLVYTSAGDAIIGLAEDGTHLVWKWVKTDVNPSGEATAKCTPPCEIKSGQLVNSLPAGMVTPTFALSRNDHYVISTSGKMISLYNMLAFKEMKSLMPSPPVCTCIVFYPPDNNIILFGMDDSSIRICNLRTGQVLRKLYGHRKKISGLAFSTTFNALISSAADTQIILWDAVTWKKRKSTMLQISAGWLASSETDIQLDKKDQKHFLAVHETQLAIYETTTLQRVNQWAISNFCTRIAHATFSCDSELVYSAMQDGIVLILGSSDLTPRFEINPSVYLPVSYCGVYPVVIAAHPKKRNQFALGLTNGAVAVVEPIAADGGWSSLPLVQARI